VAINYLKSLKKAINMHNKNGKSVIVLILNFNGKYLLEDSISSYLANDYDNFEVVVIDNGSKDGSQQWVEENYSDVFVLQTGSNLGYSRGFNYGLDYAFKKRKADYVLITNNDVKADSKVIAELVKVAEKDPMIGFVTGKVYYYDKPNVLQTVGYYEEDPTNFIGGHIGNNENDKGQYDEIAQRLFCDDIFMLVKKHVYDSVGGYDTEFKYQVEQVDWQERGKSKGFKIYYTPHAKIWHKESMTIGKSSAFKTYYDVRNPFIFRLKYKDEEYIKRYSRYYLKFKVAKPFINNLIKFRIHYSYVIISAFISAIKWGILNKKLKLSYFF
jgi:GT2 family glycosyltransferase